MLLMYKYQCDSECLNCPIAQGCEFCQGFNYDEAVTDTNFQRAKYICKMHKARVRANNYYFAKLYHEKIFVDLDLSGKRNVICFVRR